MAQIYDNWTRFFFDYITLILILLLVGYALIKKPKHMNLVYMQLVLMLAAQILYTIRSSARIFHGDKSYFGRHIPEWTYTCE